MSWPRAYAPAWGAALLLVASVPILARATGHPVSLFTRDIFGVAGLPVYASLMSHVGILLWCATCALCLFTASAMPAGRPRGFYLAFGLLTLAFLGDDLFMLHEWIMPKVTHLNETAASAIYGGSLAGILAFQRRRVLAREPALLGVAVAFFAGSVIADAMEPVPAQGWHYLLEESLKFMGIVTWATYFIRACRSEALRVAERRDG